MASYLGTAFLCLIRRDETDFVQKARWSAGKFLYIGCRYATILYVVMLIPSKSPPSTAPHKMALDHLLFHSAGIDGLLAAGEKYHVSVDIRLELTGMCSRRRPTSTYNCGAGVCPVLLSLPISSFPFRLGFIGGFSPECSSPYPFPAMLRSKVITGLMAFRTYALYAGKRNIKWFIITLFVVSIACVVDAGLTLDAQ